jgi:subtilisin family serine protease
MSASLSRWMGIVLVVFFALAAPPHAAAAPEGAGNGDVIVIFRDGTDPAQREQILRQAGAAPRRTFRLVAAAAARLPHAGARAALEQHPSVAMVIPDREMFAHAQTVPAGVKRIGAEPGSSPYTGMGVGVAVVDTGLDYNHQDLLPLGSASFTAFNGSCQDDNGHGTHVGGIIAARNNTIDVVGVAPDAILYCVKVLNKNGPGSDSTVMAGLDWIAENADQASPPIKVVNMSLGRTGTLDDNPALRGSVQALYKAGITVVVSAGNDSSKEVSQMVPAGYPEVLAVASSTALDGINNRCRSYSKIIPRDTASYFTTDGKFQSTAGIGVTISAPGADRENISRSCFVSSVGILSTRLGGGTTRMSGTSMAAPHVAGVVALMWQRFSLLYPEDARGALRSGAVLQGTAPLDSPTVGYTFDGEREGILWAPGALQ